MIKLHGIKETYNDYRKVGLLLASPYCINNCEECQNKHLKECVPKTHNISDIIGEFKHNKFIKALIFGGLDCFDSFDETLKLIIEFRKYFDYDIVLYTGKRKEQLLQEITILKTIQNIFIKFGEYNKSLPPKYDKIGGITLASSNQYFEQIS